LNGFIENIWNKINSNQFFFFKIIIKIIIGITKCPNIKTEINLLSGIYNFELIEYRRKSIKNEKKIWKKKSNNFKIKILLIKKK